MKKDWMNACAWLLLWPVVFLTFFIFLLGFAVALLLDRLVSICRSKRKQPGTDAQWEQERLWDASLNEEASCSPGDSPGQHKEVTTMQETALIVPQEGQGERATPLALAPVVTPGQATRANETYASFAHDLQDFARSRQAKFSRREQARLYSCFLCYRAQQRELLASGRAQPAQDEGVQE